MTRIVVSLEMPEPNQEQPAEAVSIEEKVRDAIECIESGHNSSVEWLLVNKIYKDLGKMKKTPRVRNLINMIEPVLAKYGYHEVTAVGE